MSGRHSSTGPADACDIRPLALTMGEPGGIGLEITLKAWTALRGDGPSFFVLDDPDRYACSDAPIQVIQHPSEARDVFRRCIPILPLSQKVAAQPGVADPENAGAVIESVERAVAITLTGDASGVVTNPIQKSSLMAAGFSFAGHTEFLAALTQDAPMARNRERGPVMLLVGPELRTAPVTIHLAVRDAIDALTREKIIHTAKVTAQALAFDLGVAHPRLAISGLNPHAGENGAMGSEDDRIIAPAIETLKAAGIDAIGPLPADTMFHSRARASYDAAICMLHDQALIPVKTLNFDSAVNVTIGLPIIRTSPDHGTALNIARPIDAVNRGNDGASATSLIAAIDMAARMAQQRKSSRAPV